MLNSNIISPFLSAEMKVKHTVTFIAAIYLIVLYFVDLQFAITFTINGVVISFVVATVYDVSQYWLWRPRTRDIGC